MNSSDPPMLLECPDSWKYTEEWQKRYEKAHGHDYLSKTCKHSNASFQIMYYICNLGEIALTKIKTQNLIIKRLTTGLVDPRRVHEHDIDWQSGSTWARLEEQWEELFEIYNVGMAPVEILRIIQEVKTFMDRGKLHCQSLLQYLVKAKAVLDQQETKRREAQRQETQQRQGSKWERIDVEHSKVTEGFVYLLSNILMPGVYKIGFTAGNPEKRANEVNARYGLPAPFQVIAYWRTKDPYIVEQRIHAALARYGRAGEFFEVDLQFAKDTIEANIQNKENGL